MTTRRSVPLCPAARPVPNLVCMDVAQVYTNYSIYKRKVVPVKRSSNPASAATSFAGRPLSPDLPNHTAAEVFNNPSQQVNKHDRAAGQHSGGNPPGEAQHQRQAGAGPSNVGGLNGWFSAMRVDDQAATGRPSSTGAPSSTPSCAAFLSCFHSLLASATGCVKRVVTCRCFKTTCSNDTKCEFRTRKIPSLMV